MRVVWCWGWSEESRQGQRIVDIVVDGSICNAMLLVRPDLPFIIIIIIILPMMMMMMRRLDARRLHY
jgi:uncharacterized membrane protein YhaH (DUF805 family)